MTDDRIRELAQQAGMEKSGPWPWIGSSMNLLSFARAIEREVRSLLAASPAQPEEKNNG